MSGIRIITNIAILIALYYLSYHIYIGVLHPSPPLGDSWDYHIPISKTILNGSFLYPQDFLLDQWYYPGSAELLNVFLIVFGLPLSFSNIIATVALFFALFKLGKTFNLEKYYSILFALSFVTLNSVVRWLNFALVDIWVAVFFILTIIILEKPKDSLGYFLKLGFVVGMMVGSKYTSVIFLVPLLGFYVKRLSKVISINNILVFLIPFSIFGLFWYVRNFYYMGNPFWPLSFLNFPSSELFSDHRVWDVFLNYPLVMVDSFFAELKLWTLAIPVALLFIIKKFAFDKNYQLNSVLKLFLLGIVNFMFFFNFPTSPESWIMVSSIRYLYPALIPLFLGIFLLAKKYKKEELLGYFVIANMLFVTSLNYYPKLIFFFLPVFFVVFYYLNKSIFQK